MSNQEVENTVVESVAMDQAVRDAADAMAGALQSAPACPQAPVVPEGAIYNPQNATGDLHLGIDGVNHGQARRAQRRQQPIVHAKYQLPHRRARLRRDLFAGRCRRAGRCLHDLRHHRFGRLARSG